VFSYPFVEGDDIIFKVGSTARSVVRGKMSLGTYTTELCLLKAAVVCFVGLEARTLLPISRRPRQEVYISLSVECTVCKVFTYCATKVYFCTIEDIASGTLH
jgi:hypothetical protein